ncbi:MAG: cache domain-containing protein [Saprospiraceae bacterium]
MVKNILFATAIGLFMALLFLLYQFVQFTQQRNAYVEEQGLQTTTELRDRVDEILAKIVAEGEQLAQRFGENNYTAEEVESIIRNSSLKISEIQGITACFEPYALSTDTRLYCPYYNKGTRDYNYVEKSYDYTDTKRAGTGWYTSVRDTGAKWVEPYYGQAAQDWYIDYGIPFYYQKGAKKGQVRGTITMSFVASGFKKLIQQMALGKTGYGIIVSQQGTFLAHPQSEYVGTTKLDSIKAQVSPELAAAFTKLGERQSGNIQYTDKTSDSKTLFFYDRIPTADWGLGVLFYKDDLLNDSTELNRMYIKISLVFSLFFVCLLAMYYNKDYLDEREIWSLSLVSSLLLLSNIVFIGYLQHTDRYVHAANESQPVTALSTVDDLVSEQRERADTLKLPAPIPIPTGIYVDKMEFEDSYNLNAGGKIWQKYPLEIADSVDIGFHLPQLSPFAEASYIEEAYRKRIAPKEDEAGYLLVGWDFRVTLKLNLQYKDYPLDKRHLNLEIVPLNNNDHLMFVPDLLSYTYTNPSRRSGLNPAIAIPGSEVLETYFNYSFETYDTDFGYADPSLFEGVPILHYNIRLRRYLLNAFVTYLIPIFITLIMVFILIYACHKTQERQGIIESMAAFFFVLIFSHIDLRREIVTADLIYMEFFYFIAYSLLVVSTFNLITYTRDKSKLFDFNDNQIFKASFFPLFFLLLLVVTLVKFY